VEHVFLIAIPKEFASSPLLDAAVDDWHPRKLDWPDGFFNGEALLMMVTHDA